MVRLFLQILFFSLLPVGLCAQTVPMLKGSKLFLRYFKASDYKADAQNWDVAQDSSGLIYVANSKGVLQYDGYRWNRIPLPNHNGARQLAYYNDTLFVGGNGTWGYLQPDSVGRLKFVSMRKKTEALGIKLKATWRLIGTSYGLYIQSGYHLMKWNKGHLYAFPDSLTAWSVFWSGKRLLAYLSNHTLVEIKGKSVIPFYDGDDLNNKYIRAGVHVKGDSLALFTSSRAYILADGKVRPWKTGADKLLNHSWIQHTHHLTSGNIAITSATTGLIILSPDGELLQHVDKARGLATNSTVNVFEDRANDIWLTTSNGIFVLNGTFSQSYYDNDDFFGSVMDAAMYKNHLYIATNYATYKYEPDKEKQFVKVPQTVTQCWTLLPTKQGLMLGSESGADILNKGRWTHLLDHKQVYILKRSNVDSTVIYAGTQRGLFRILLRNGKWVPGGRVIKDNEQISSIYELPDGGLIAAGQEGLLHIQFLEGGGTKVRHYDEREGLPAGHLELNKLGNYFQAKAGDTSVWFNVTDDSIKITLPPLSLKQTSFESIAGIKGKPDQYWGWTGRHAGLITHSDSGWRWKPSQAELFRPYQIDGIYPTTDGSVWIGAEQKLIHISATETNRTFVRNSAPLIRRLQYPGGEVRFYADPEKGNRLEFSPKVSKLQVNFSAVSYLQPKDIQYQTRLKGLNDEWSNWTNNSTVPYNGLDYGKYTFEVRSRNSDGSISIPAELSFTILPHWYQTWWAKLFYIIIGAGFVGVFLQWRTTSLKRQSRLLAKRVTDRTKALETSNNKIIQQAEKLQELDVMKDRFYTNISHDLRTPLTLILGPVSTILNRDGEGLSPYLRKQLDSVLRNSQRLERLVNQMLDLTRIESGIMQLRISNNDLSDFVTKTASAFDSFAENNGIIFQINIPDTPCYLYYDPVQLEKVLTNLLSNAIKFTSRGGTVEIQLQESEEVTEIHVKDTGLGISEKDLPHIFNRFYQVDNGKLHQEEGLGVGLALSRKLIEMHHGTLTACNRKVDGSIFTIRLLNGKAHFWKGQVEEGTKVQLIEPKPYTPESVGLKNMQNGNSNGFAGSSNQNRKTLFVIDDNRDMCEYVRDVMAPDYLVLQAHDGIQGLEMIKKELPDIILCDVMMPEMNGFELSRKLKESAMTEAIPIIFLSGRADKKAQLEGLNTGADDYITKPFDAKLLQSRVKNLIEQRMRLRRRLSHELAEPEPIPEPVQSVFEKQVRETILKNLTNEQFGVEKLAQEAAISSSHLTRKLKDETGMTANELIRTIRLERAAGLLKNREGNVSEIAYSVGFNSLSYFSRCFKEQFNKAPSEYIVN
jgi:signal transduction histidine kinase/DNA-binding response OmpR family regulator/ligand-binding sensor domain-containing protein